MLCLLAGLAGGVVVTKGHHGSFSAEELLEVRPGNTPANPGGAQEASALAVTYAALVPSDTAVVNALSRRLGVSASSVAGGLSATAESGTGLFVVSYSSPTASKAIAGANEAGSVLASAAPPGLAIVARSVAVVKRATSATKSKDAHLYGLVGGLVGGGLLGIVLVLGLERVDARVDDPEDAAERCGCPATRLPGGMSSRELAVALARLSGDEPLTLVPTSPRARATAEHLARVLATSWPAGERCTLTVAGAEPSGGPSEGAGPTVLVVPDGEPARSVVEVADRLRLMARPPVFSVVCARS